jgi:co-chaperonin GroES (HSP10)
MISKTGRVVAVFARRMDEFVRREDGSETSILADTRFNNHEKMNIAGVVKVGTDAPDTNPVEDADRIMPRCHHYPQGYMGGGVFPVDIRPGDRIWCHYLCLEDMSSANRVHDGSWEVNLQVSDIFCIKRDGRMIMNQNWCIGKEVKESDLVLVDAIGDKKEPEMTPAKGIQMIKGFNVKSYVDEAIITQIDSCRYRGVHDEVKQNDRVYLAKDSAFPNVIDNKQALLVRQVDIIAIWHKDPAQVRPVGENHLIEVDPLEYKSTVIHHTVITKAPEYGTIIASGKACKNGKPGDKIMFTRRWTRLLNKNYWLIDDSEIQAHVQ